MKNHSLIIGVIIFLCMGSAADAKYNGGTGEPNDPYRIATPENLNDVGNHQEDWDKHFILVNDVNFTEYAGTQSESIGIYIEWNEPNNRPFTGVFDGNDNAIWNFTLNSDRRNSVGLFGYLGYAGQIRNLRMENIDINDVNSVYIGGLVGFNQGSIMNCLMSGSVKGYHNVGGLVGTNDAGTITNCYSRCSILGTGWNVGGLVGANDTGTITDCSYTGAISGYYNVGGLVGDNDTGTIRDCDSAGSVSGGADGFNIGGLTGFSDGEIMGCYSTGSVDGNIPVGGLAGHNDGTIMNCYSTCSVSGAYIIGGLAGLNDEGIITRCYSTGSVSGTGWNIGGLVGYRNPDDGFVRDSFWDIETSGQSTSSGGTGKTTAEMQTMSTFTEAGWDFDTVWWMPPGNYPRLVCQRLYSGGSGTQEDPYILKTVGDWQKLMNTPGDWDKHFILAADIDFQGVALSPVGNFSQRFTGVFDGDAHILCNADVNMPSSDYVGIFGYVSWHSQIRNLGVKDVTITGNSCVGGIVGWNEGDMTGCYATGSVEGVVSVGGLVGDNSADLVGCYAACLVGGNGFVGGLVGYSDEYCDLTACYATSTVKGGGYYCIGGLVGMNYSNLAACYATGPVDGNGAVGGLVGSNGDDGCIIDCYSTGPVSGMSQVGGLVGYNGEHSHIARCYATGSVDGNEVVGGLVANKEEEGSITASFWDVESTGQPTSFGGQGKTTAEMKGIGTFTDAGWDFVEVWDIGENQTYPFLRSEPAGDLNYDRQVDFVDLATLAMHWLAQSSP